MALVLVLGQWAFLLPSFSLWTHGFWPRTQGRFRVRQGLMVRPHQDFRKLQIPSFQDHCRREQLVAAPLFVSLQSFVLIERSSKSTLRFRCLGGAGCFCCWALLNFALFGFDVFLIIKYALLERLNRQSILITRSCVTLYFIEQYLHRKIILILGVSHYILH